MRRVLISSLCFLLALSVSSAADAAPCWRPPVTGPIADPYREPACRFCAGNRGIEYSTERRAPVTAVAAGLVTWSGVVAETRYVVVRLADGRRVTYGQLSAASVMSGDRVVAGQIIGRSSDRLHFGLRAGLDYLDPTALIGELVGRPRLLPVDGARPWPAPTPRLRCGR